jgi:uncharacterized protein
MKYLLLLALVLIVVWFVRSSRRRESADTRPGGSSPAQPQDMVQCAFCSVHMPRTDALPGPDGRLYCCAEHRLHAGD